MGLTKKINTTITRSELFDICLNASRVCACSVMIDTDKAQCLLHLSDTGKAQCLLHLLQHFDQLCNYASCAINWVYTQSFALCFTSQKRVSQSQIMLLLFVCLASHSLSTAAKSFEIHCFLYTLTKCYIKTDEGEMGEWGGGGGRGAEWR